MKLLHGALLSVLTLGTTLGVSQQASASEQVNIYSYRQPFLIEPVVEKFTKDTGIKVNVVFAKKGLVERLQREGKHSPADLVLTTDISRLMELVDKGLTQPVNSEILNSNIPSQFRGPEQQWYGLTLRVRNIYSSKDRLESHNFSYEELADPKYKGKICTRSGKHPYNVALISSMIAHHGYTDAKNWLNGFKENLARRPQGNDRAQVRAVKEGECDLALGNSYYYGKMLTDDKQRPWAQAVNIVFPNQANRGAHVNVSGMVLTKNSSNKAASVKLMEYLSGNAAQQIYAQVNMEYPVKADVAPSTLVASWGDFNADNLAMAKISENRKLALKMLDEVKFDL